MDPIGVGVVGCGFVGRGAHVPAFHSMEQARLVAVADPDTKRLGKVAKKYQPQATYEDYADLVRDPNVQAVVVSAPTPLHAPAAMAAIQAAKHVLCEMPLAATVDDLNGDPTVDGILVQLPLPDQLTEREILDRIDPEKDVDGFHPVNVGRLWLDLPGFAPATPSGIIELLRRRGWTLRLQWVPSRPACTCCAKCRWPPRWTRRIG